MVQLFNIILSPSRFIPFHSFLNLLFNSQRECNDSRPHLKCCEYPGRPIVIIVCTLIKPSKQRRERGRALKVMVIVLAIGSSQLQTNVPTSESSQDVLAPSPSKGWVFALSHWFSRTHSLNVLMIMSVNDSRVQLCYRIRPSMREGGKTSLFDHYVNVTEWLNQRRNEGERSVAQKCNKSHYVNRIQTHMRETTVEQH